MIHDFFLHELWYSYIQVLSFILEFWLECFLERKKTCNDFECCQTGGDSSMLCSFLLLQETSLDRHDVRPRHQHPTTNNSQPNTRHTKHHKHARLRACHRWLALGPDGRVRWVGLDSPEDSPYFPQDTNFIRIMLLVPSHSCNLFFIISHFLWYLFFVFEKIPGPPTKTSPIFRVR